MKYQSALAVPISLELVVQLYNDGYVHHWRSADGRIERDYLTHEAFVDFLNLRDDPDGGCIIQIDDYDKPIANRNAYACGYSKAYIENGQLTCQWQPISGNMSQIFVDAIARKYKH